MVISVLAGKKVAALAQASSPRPRNLVRSMPNTPGQIGAGLTGWCSQSPLGQPDRGILDAVFGALGLSIELPEAQIDGFTAICGCGPAYVFEFAAAIRDAGLGLGFDASKSKLFAVETLLGAARLLARRDVDPEVLRGEVTSPNGVTAAGLRKMADRGISGGSSARPWSPQRRGPRSFPSDGRQRARRQNPRHRRGGLHRERARVGAQFPGM